MKASEFQELVHDYMTQDKGEAERYCRSINENAEDFKAIVQHFNGIGYCLMLDSAKDFLGL